MNKLYSLNGSLFWFKEGEAPAEAIPVEKAKKITPAKAEPKPEALKAKAKTATANKARKAGGNK